jgi:hypothetical protein
VWDIAACGLEVGRPNASLRHPVRRAGRLRRLDQVTGPFLAIGAGLRVIRRASSVAERPWPNHAGEERVHPCLLRIVRLRRPLVRAKELQPLPAFSGDDRRLVVFVGRATAGAAFASSDVSIRVHTLLRLLAFVTTGGISSGNHPLLPRRGACSGSAW